MNKQSDVGMYIMLFYELKLIFMPGVSTFDSKKIKFQT